MTALVGAVVHRYEPRGAAAELLRRRDGEVLMSGPAGTGKSRACLEKLNLMCMLNPGMRGLIVRKVSRSLATTALDTWRKFVVKELLTNGGVTYYGGSAVEPPQYRYSNGSTVMIGGMDSADKIMSSEYDVIYVQEATELTVTDWEALLTRLRNWVVSFQQLIADCNPNAEMHWLKQRCNGGLAAILWSKHQDNPALFGDGGTMTEAGEAYMATLDRLTGVRRLRLRDGIWASAEGLVYERWDDSIHLIDRFDVPVDWPRVWSLDFGFTNPFVCQCWATDPDGRLILEWEIYYTRRLVEEHCETLARYCMADPRREIDGDGRPGAWVGEWVRPRPEAVVADHDAEGRATFEKHLGLSTRAAVKRVNDGIQAVDARMTPAGDGRPRLMLMRDAVIERDPELASKALPTCTAEEFPSYVWAQTPGKPPKEEPVKENDHGMDTTRYRVADIDLKGVADIRWL
jgi:PBSX family phage terminase large subunit